MLSAEPNSSCGCGKVVWRSERWRSSAFVTIGTHDAILDMGRRPRGDECANTNSGETSSEKKEFFPAACRPLCSKPLLFSQKWRLPSRRGAGTRSPQLKEGVEPPSGRDYMYIHMCMCMYVRDFRIECLSLKHLMTGWKRKARTGFWCSVADRVRVSQGAFAYKRLFWLLCQALSWWHGRRFYSPASAGNSCLWR